MTHTPDLKLDWPKLVLARIGRAKTKIAKHGLFDGPPRLATVRRPNRMGSDSPWPWRNIKRSGCIAR